MSCPLSTDDDFVPGPLQELASPASPPTWRTSEGCAFPGSRQAVARANSTCCARPRTARAVSGRMFQVPRLLASVIPPSP